MQFQEKTDEEEECTKIRSEKAGNMENRSFTSFAFTCNERRKSGRASRERADTRDGSESSERMIATRTDVTIEFYSHFPLRFTARQKEPVNEENEGTNEPSHGENERE